MGKVLIIAEAGVNHNGDIALAKKLIEVAAEAGADIVKFQTFKADKLVSKAARKAAYQVQNTPMDADDSQLQMLKRLELNAAMHEELILHCKTYGIRFLSTAFDMESLAYLNTLGMPIFKIPSGEITNLPYLRAIGTFKKEVILSTGMATLGEIEDALAVLSKAGTPLSAITVLHCTTEYPTPMDEVNLRAMQTIAQAFKVKVGYSDHTQGIEIPIAAVALGATVIEKHFTLDRTMDGPDHRASLEPTELIAMVTAIRNLERAMGDGIKKPSPSESKNKEVARKSIHLASDLPQGHVLTEEDVRMKRPGSGISPMQLDQVIGKKLRESVEADESLRWEDLQ